MSTPADNKPAEVVAEVTPVVEETEAAPVVETTETAEVTPEVVEAVVEATVAATTEAPATPEGSNDEGEAIPRHMLEPEEESHDVFIGNLSQTVSEELLQAVFGEIEGLKTIDIIRDESNCVRGYGFLRFLTQEGQTAALSEKYQDVEVAGSVVRIARTTRGANLKIWISGIPNELSQEELEAELHRIIPDLAPFAVELPTEKTYNSDAPSAKNRGFCFVQLNSKSAAKLALEKLDDQDIGGSKVRAKWGRVTPEPASPPFRRLFVGNLPTSYTEQQLIELGSQFGEVDTVNIPRAPEGEENKGYGFVTFVNHAEFLKAKKGLEGVTIEERHLTVGVATRSQPSQSYFQGNNGGYRGGYYNGNGNRRFNNNNNGGNRRPQQQGGYRRDSRDGGRMQGGGYRRDGGYNGGNNNGGNNRRYNGGNRNNNNNNGGRRMQQQRGGDQQGNRGGGRRYNSGSNGNRQGGRSSGNGQGRPMQQGEFPPIAGSRNQGQQQAQAQQQQKWAAFTNDSPQPASPQGQQQGQQPQGQQPQGQQAQGQWQHQQMVYSANPMMYPGYPGTTVPAATGFDAQGAGAPAQWWSQQGAPAAGQPQQGAQAATAMYATGQFPTEHSM